ncbi:hypothetical protein SBRCBS47491_004688 [Sporothrix bragantina]|uniref:DUF6546 domain-containing protein n=1 Tax=Sporothrix bragantina TaxID=671064 RepID=A0ABP0BQM8_9PEZI
MACDIGVPEYLTVPALSRLDIVRTLEVTRRFYRIIDPLLLARIIESCPALVDVRLEQWLPTTGLTHKHVKAAYEILLAETKLPATMRFLSLYQDSNSVINDRQISFYAEADDFFSVIEPCYPTKANCDCPKCKKNLEWDMAMPPPVPGQTMPFHWPILKYLALTSSTLSPTSSPQQIRDLLMGAGKAAMRMPALDCMELWFGQDDSDHACLFTWIRKAQNAKGKAQPPVLELSATWDIQDVLSSENSNVLQQWQAVSDMHRDIQRSLAGPVNRYGP